ncbi:hypothetical protein PQR75_45800 [Paraburkholderia fungorum]|uniref:hypothetical protein n=1 Tax=Paraburkholderia fungorum TaxID=134537 RepID=UPI0038BBC4A7
MPGETDQDKRARWSVSGHRSMRAMTVCNSWSVAIAHGASANGAAARVDFNAIAGPAREAAHDTSMCEAIDLLEFAY